MKIVCVSDTHTYGSQINVPEGDVLIHAGDHTFDGTQKEVTSAMKWLESLPHKHKVIIAGNHDFFFDERFPDGYRFRNWTITRDRTVKEFMEAFPSLTYLQDSGCEIEGAKFYGSPWQPWFHGWAFNFDAPPAIPFMDEDRSSYQAHAKWAEIPDDTNILITHGPPKGILDWVIGAFGDNRAGCPYLRKRIDTLPYLKLHVFGHLHESYGKAKGVNACGNPTTFVNAAINTRNYEPTNSPIVIEL